MSRSRTRLGRPKRYQSIWTDGQAPIFTSRIPNTLFPFLPMPSRRRFLQSSAAVAGALSLRPKALAASLASAAERTVSRAPASLSILILGGTGFTGPEQVNYAIARGHRVTLFNRGRTRPGIFK